MLSLIFQVAIEFFIENPDYFTVLVLIFVLSVSCALVWIYPEKE